MHPVQKVSLEPCPLSIQLRKAHNPETGAGLLTRLSIGKTSGYTVCSWPVRSQGRATSVLLWCAGHSSFADASMHTRAPLSPSYLCLCERERERESRALANLLPTLSPSLSPWRRNLPSAPEVDSRKWIRASHSAKPHKGLVWRMSVKSMLFQYICSV